MSTLVAGRGVRLFCIVAVGAAVGCAAEPARLPVSVPAVLNSAPSHVASPPKDSLPQATAAQAALADDLRELVTALVQVGERNSEHEWNLAVATDLLAERLEGFGYEVVRQGFMYKGVLGQNLSVQAVGREHEGEVVLVGARYDSPLGSPGADDNATGAAAVVALAKRFARTQPQRTLRFVLFSDAAAQAAYEAAGSSHAARLAHEEKQKLVAVVELYGLGVFSTKPDSQSYPPGMPVVRSTADFIELTSYPEYSALAEQMAQGMKAASAVPVLTSLLLERNLVNPTAAHRAFLDYQFPAMMVTDTQRRRFAEFGGRADTVEQIDFDRFSRVTLGVESGLLNLAGPLGVPNTNQPSATPPSATPPSVTPPSATTKP